MQDQTSPACTMRRGEKFIAAFWLFTSNNGRKAIKRLNLLYTYSIQSYSFRSFKPYDSKNHKDFIPSSSNKINYN